MQRQDWYAVAALALIAVAMFLPALSTPQAFPTGYDIVRQRSYFFTVLHNSFQQTGALPLWDPYTFAGYSAIASPHEQFFFPLHLLVLLIPPDYLFFPLLLLFVFFAGVSTYALARRWLLPLPAFASALIYMLSGTLLAKIRNGVFSYFELIALLPLLFFAVERLLERPTMRRSLQVSLVAALLLTINNLQLFFYGCLALGLYVLLRMSYTKWPQVGKVVQALCLAGILSLFLAAVVLIPLFAGTSQGTIAQETDFAFQTEGSLSPQTLALFILPWAFGSPERYFGPQPWGVLYNFIGIIPLFLTLCAILYARNAVIKPLLWLGGFALLFSLGKYTPFYRLLLALPGFSFFRFPSKMMVIFVLVVALLSGFGLQQLGKMQLTAHQKKWWKIFFWTCALLAMLFVVVLIAAKSPILVHGQSLLTDRYQTEPRDRPLEQYLPLVEKVYTDILANAVILVIILIVIALVVDRWFGRKTGISFLVALLLMELVLFHSPFIKSQPREVVFGNNPVAEFLAAEPGMFRVLDTARVLPQDIAVRHGIFLLEGYNTNHLQSYTHLTNQIGGFSPKIVTRPQIITLDLDHIVDQPLLNLFNAKYVITDKTVANPDYQLRFQTLMHIRDTDQERTVFVYENLGTRERVFFVPGALYPDIPNAPLIQSAELKEYAPNSIVALSAQNTDGLLVFSEMWYPGWKAFDNGSPVALRNVAGGFRAVPLTAGSHTVTLRFMPKEYLIGKWISAIAVLIVAFLWLRFPESGVLQHARKRS